MDFIVIITPTPDTQIQNLIDGNAFVPPQSLSAKRTELQENIRDIEQGLDYLAGKERLVTMKAGARLAKDIKPQHDIAAKNWPLRWLSCMKSIWCIGPPSDTL